MIVIDTNILVDFWVGEPEFKNAARKLFIADHAWCAPSLWKYEFGAVLSHYERLGRLSKSSKYQAIEECQKMVQTFESIDMEAIAKLSESKGLKFYDASYVWLAMCKKIKLVTRDQQITRACPELIYNPT